MVVYGYKGYLLTLDGRVRENWPTKISDGGFKNQAIDEVYFETKSDAQQAYFDLQNGNVTIAQLQEFQWEKDSPLVANDWRNPGKETLMEENEDV